VNINKKFKEKAPSVIEKIKMEMAEAVARQKSVDDERRNKNKGKG
jgi:hypothetical protein